MPNRISFSKVVRRAREAGNEATKLRYVEIADNPLWSECGGAHIRLLAEEEKWKKFFDSLITNPLKGFTISGGHRGNYFISISGMAAYQQVTVCVAAANAALAVFETEVGITGNVVAYLS